MSLLSIFVILVNNYFKETQKKRKYFLAQYRIIYYPVFNTVAKNQTLKRREKMKNFYAIANGHGLNEDIYAAGCVMHSVEDSAYSDLMRFSSKKERDNFVDESDDHHAITIAEIKADQHYKRQLKDMN